MSTKQFFDTLPKNDQNKTTFGEILNACNSYFSSIIVIDPSVPVIPNWIWNLQMQNALQTDTQISQEQFLEFNNTFPELNASIEKFSEIDSDADQIITFEELLNAYKNPPTIIPQNHSTLNWLENLKNEENLIESSEISLDDLLQFEEKYNTMHYWPPISQ